MANEIGASVPKNQLILWSGLGKREKGVILSQEYARLNGGRTLEMTAGGRWLNDMDVFNSNSPFTGAQADQIWLEVSTPLFTKPASK